MNTTKELLEDIFDYFSKKDMLCEFKDENMLLVRFEDARLENLKYIPIIIVVDAENLRCNFYCFSLCQIPEDKKMATAVTLNTINDADVVFCRYSMDNDSEIKASLFTMILPDNHINSLLITGFVARMAKDIDNVYPALKNSLNC